jgi:cytoplasmic iron level regulating protein YaaA (DUF328/UPF0246 family)
MSKLIISPSKTKEFAKYASKEHRNGMFTRVSQDMIDNWDARFKAMIIADVKRHPSLGKTLMP